MIPWITVLPGFDYLYLFPRMCNFKTMYLAVEVLLSKSPELPVNWQPLDMAICSKEMICAPENKQEFKTFCHYLVNLMEINSTDKS